jgi:hypothetical protein
MGLLDAANAFVTCTTLELSTQSLNKDIRSFFTRSHSVSMIIIRLAMCYALLRMRPLSISNVLLYFLAEKSIMTNLTSEAIDARCGDCV